MSRGCANEARQRHLVQLVPVRVHSRYSTDGIGMSGANTSYAVRAQRQDRNAANPDFHCTRKWAVRALMEHVMKPLGLHDRTHRVWDPACGAGHMVEALREYYPARNVSGVDLYDYGYGYASGADFLAPGSGARRSPHWIITNPPFRLLNEFIAAAIAKASIGVAIFCATTRLEGAARYRSIYQPYEGRFTAAQFVERAPCNRGLPKRDDTTATAYMWLVIRPAGHVAPALLHIPPCRRILERGSDY